MAHMRIVYGANSFTMSLGKSAMSPAMHRQSCCNVVRVFLMRTSSVTRDYRWAQMYTHVEHICARSNSLCHRCNTTAQPLG